jgi:hypothetical protein
MLHLVLGIKVLRSVAVFSSAQVITKLPGQVSNDVSEFTCANFLQPGEKTPVAARLSTVTHEKGYVLFWSCCWLCGFLALVQYSECISSARVNACLCCISCVQVVRPGVV